MIESTNDTKVTKYRSNDVISKLSNDYSLNSPIEPVKVSPTTKLPLTEETTPELAVILPVLNQLLLAM